MDELKSTKRFHEYINSDDAAVDIFRVNRTLQKVLWDRAFEVGFVEGVASATRIETPEPEPPRAA